jgi:hypothetical protein
MQLLVPDILEDAQGLSAAIAGMVLAVGFFIWLFGWRGHRFWIVLAATVAAGLMGLYTAPAIHSHPLVAGLLLAVAAGALALALVRFVAFAAGGLAAWAVVHALIPAWNEPLMPMLIGGLIGLLLFRIWTMALTSSAGTLLMAYAGLCLAHKLGNVDILALAEKRRVLLNAACGGLALLGFVGQLLLGRRRRGGKSAGKKKSKGDDEDGSPSLWERAQRVYRLAG